MSIEVVVKQDRDRAFHVVFFRLHAAGVRVFAGRGDGEFLFGLQELQGVGGFLGSFLFDNGEDFVFEVFLAEVVEALAGHRGVFHLCLGREE